MTDIHEPMNNEDDFDGILMMTDDDGNDVPFEFLNVVEYEDKEYIVLMPAEHDEADGIVILKIEETKEDDEMEVYSAIEDEQELQAVFDIFKERFTETWGLSGE